MRLDRNTYDEIREILLPHMDEPDRRRALVHDAFQDVPKLLQQVRWGGDAITFTSSLIETCIDFGEVRPKEQAIVTLLRELEPRVGERPQQRIRLVCIHIEQLAKETTRPMYDSSRVPAQQPSQQYFNNPPTRKTGSYRAAGLTTQVGGAVVIGILLLLLVVIAMGQGLFGGGNNAPIISTGTNRPAENNTSPATTTPNARAYYRQGSDAEQNGDLLGALSAYNTSIELDDTSPNSVDVYIARGNIFLQQGEINAALADFEQAIFIAPNNPEPYYHQGVAYNQQGNKQNAMTHFNLAIENSNTPYAEAYYHRGQLYIEQENYRAAIADLNVAIDNTNRPPATYYNGRGWAYLQQGQPNAAIADFEIALAIDPDFDEAQVNLETAQAAIGN